MTKYLVISFCRRRLRKRKKSEENSGQDGSEDRSEDGSVTKNSDSSIAKTAAQDNTEVLISDEEDSIQRGIMGLREPSRFEPNLEPTEVKRSPLKSVRDFFGEDEAVYIMDAKTMGNIGRYLNVSFKYCKILILVKIFFLKSKKFYLNILDDFPIFFSKILDSFEKKKTGLANIYLLRWLGSKIWNDQIRNLFQNF